MNKRTRNIIFLILVAIFLIATPSIILYSQGYRIDFSQKKITQTGAFFFKVEPVRAEIKITDKEVKKTDFFFHSALIENVIPKKYNVKITKEGYHSWEKELEIKPKAVTESKSIVLIPENPEITIASENTQQIWNLPDKKTYILLEKEKKSSWALKTYDIEKRLKTYLLQESDFNTSADFIDLKISDNGEKIVLKIGIKERIKYYLLNIKKPSTPILLTFFNSDINKIAFDPQDNNKIIYTKNEVLFKYDIEKQQYSPILGKDNTTISNIISFEIKNDEIYFLNKSGFLIKSDSLFQNFEQMNKEKFSIKQETPYEIQIFNDYIFLIENKTAYMLNKESKNFEPFFENTSNIILSLSNTKIAYFSNHEIWFMYLQKNYEGIEKNAGDKQFLFRTSQDIKNVIWLNDHYLAYIADNKIRITETDTRDKLNIVDVVETNNPLISWNETKKELLILSNLNLSLYSYPAF